MKLNRISLIVAGALALGSMQSAMACSFTAWGQGSPPGGGVVGTPINGEPDDATPVARYAGRCGLRATTTGSYVQDGLPTAEATYNAQFYAFTGGPGTYFVAEDGSAVAQITVAFNGTGLDISRAGAGPGNIATVPATANRWYRVLVQWSATAGTLGYTVRGAGGNEASSVTGQLTGVLNAARIETARLGLITGTGPMNADAFESRRTSAPTALCRGDANNDVLLGVQDRIILTNEILGTSLSTGQPDVNEDALVSVQDRILITTRILAADACP